MPWGSESVVTLTSCICTQPGNGVCYKWLHQDRLAHVRFFGLMHSEKEGFSEKTSIVKHSTVKRSLLVKLASKYSYSF